MKNIHVEVHFLYLKLTFRYKMVDAATKKALSGIPLLKTKAGPRDKELWVTRLKEFIYFGSLKIL